MLKVWVVLPETIGQRQVTHSTIDHDSIEGSYTTPHPDYHVPQTWPRQNFFEGHSGSCSFFFLEGAGGGGGGARRGKGKLGQISIGLSVNRSSYLKP